MLRHLHKHGLDCNLVIRKVVNEYGFFLLITIELCISDFSPVPPGPSFRRLFAALLLVFLIVGDVLRLQVIHWCKLVRVFLIHSFVLYLFCVVIIDGSSSLSMDDPRSN